MLNLLDVPTTPAVLDSPTGFFLMAGLAIVISSIVLVIMRKRKQK